MQARPDFGSGRADARSRPANGPKKLSEEKKNGDEKKSNGVHTVSGYPGDHPLRLFLTVNRAVDVRR